ncbi:hypothetical protein O0555_23695 [Brevibacillus laterosporus]|uniref:hypothetical protein n=1 Tax=Brevibacillus laterosporus TaxID=1465 RepID=UPI0018CD961F|nr:hypothetical protein [Brevibacillus laterosporus]MCR8940283.1 hypothetical protein [Brevibacillus laterosporus]MCZ0842922.1 hypothetical protein [Brevibacillus laterosporus]MCZ0846858.1 hypothetical protein [Brevibacillus laterosporus]MED1913645.1 hypothetical protein [Brevibacillus laterosporus]
MDYISFSVDGTRSTIIRLVKNATLGGGTPVFTDISIDTSVMEFDTDTQLFQTGEPYF